MEKSDWWWAVVQWPNDFLTKKWHKKWPILFVLYVNMTIFWRKSVQKILTFWFSSCRKSDQWWSVVQWPQNNYAVNTTSKKNVIQLNEKSHEIHFSTKNCTTSRLEWLSDNDYSKLNVYSSTVKIRDYCDQKVFVFV